MKKQLFIFFYLIISTHTLGSGLRCENGPQEECILGCFSLVKWMKSGSKDIVIPLLDDVLDDEESVFVNFDLNNIDYDDGYESEIDESTRIVSRKFPINLKHLDNNPRVLDQMIMRFYDLVITNKVTNLFLFFNRIREPHLNYDATVKMYYACCNYEYEGLRYKGVSYRKILKKVSMLLQDPFFGFTFFR
ncbi:MAG: hypothetical protein AB8G05_18670 [Oligoflexales bacterium]